MGVACEIVASALFVGGEVAALEDIVRALVVVLIVEGTLLEFVETRLDEAKAGEAEEDEDTLYAALERARKAAKKFTRNGRLVGMLKVGSSRCGFVRSGLAGN